MTKTAGEEEGRQLQDSDIRAARPSGSLPFSSPTTVLTAHAHHSGQTAHSVPVLLPLDLCFAPPKSVP